MLTQKLKFFTLGTKVPAPAPPTIPATSSQTPYSTQGRGSFIPSKGAFQEVWEKTHPFYHEVDFLGEQWVVFTEVRIKSV